MSANSRSLARPLARHLPLSACESNDETSSSRGAESSSTPMPSSSELRWVPIVDCRERLLVAVGSSPDYKRRKNVITIYIASLAYRCRHHRRCRRSYCRRCCRRGRRVQLADCNCGGGRRLRRQKTVGGRECGMLAKRRVQKRANARRAVALPPSRRSRRLGGVGDRRR